MNFACGSRAQREVDRDFSWLVCSLSPACAGRMRRQPESRPQVLRGHKAGSPSASFLPSQRRRWAMGCRAGHPSNPAGARAGGTGAGDGGCSPCEKAGGPLALPLLQNPWGLRFCQLLLCRAVPCCAVPCCATPQVRFRSARNDRGNIYTEARAHLIFMEWLFIDGERLAQAPQGSFFRHVPAAPHISGVSPPLGSCRLLPSPPRRRAGAGAGGITQLRSFAAVASGADYKIPHEAGGKHA